MQFEKVTACMMRRSYLGLDVVRLGAAVLVMFYHLGFWWWRPVQGDYATFREVLAPIAPFVSAGWVGVPIFFVISGFVIAFSANQKTAEQFVKGRVSRLYPAAWVCATITATIVTPTFATYLRSLALSPLGPWVSGAYWTLAIEIIFYTMVAVGLALGGSKILPKIASGLGIYSCAFWTAKALNSVIGHPIPFDAIEGNRGFLLLAHDGLFFALGMTLWQISQGARPIARGVILTVFGMMAVLWRSHALNLEGAPFYVAGLIWLAAVALIFASVIWNAIAWTHFGKWSGVIRVIGLMTYPLYLVHAELGRWVMLRFESPWLALTVATATALFVALAVLPIEAAIRVHLTSRSTRERSAHP